MIKPPITHLILDTSSSNENYNGDCDYGLIPLCPQYVADLLRFMDHVAQLHRRNEHVCGMEIWDGTPAYFRYHERLETLQDIHGRIVTEVPRGEPILLSADPGIATEEFQRTECRTVQVSHREAWWTAYVKHTSTRIETMRIDQKVLRDIHRRFKAHTTAT